jgi:hypothetical protein
MRPLCDEAQEPRCLRSHDSAGDGDNARGEERPCRSRMTIRAGAGCVADLSAALMKPSVENRLIEIDVPFSHARVPSGKSEVSQTFGLIEPDQ